MLNRNPLYLLVMSAMPLMMASRAAAAKAKPDAMLPEGAKADQPATVQKAPESKPSNVIPHPAVLVYDGNTQLFNIADTPQVHPADIEQAGTALKRLAFNVLLGNVDPALMDKDGKFWANRTIKDHKTAFFGLIGVKGKDGKAGGQIILEAWNREMEAKRSNPRGRIAQVSLTGLWKLFKPAREGGGESPYSRIKAKLEALKKEVLAIVESSASPKRKLEMIAEKCQPDEDNEE